MTKGIVYLAPHGETAWSLTGQHNGLMYLPRTPRGERRASRLRKRLEGLTLDKVFTSPLERARKTCEFGEAIVHEAVAPTCSSRFPEPRKGPTTCSTRRRMRGTAELRTEDSQVTQPFKKQLRSVGIAIQLNVGPHGRFQRTTGV